MEIVGRSLVGLRGQEIQLCFEGRRRAMNNGEKGKRKEGNKRKEEGRREGKEGEKEKELRERTWTMGRLLFASCCCTHKRGTDRLTYEKKKKLITMTNGKSSRGPVIIVPAPQLRRSLLEGTLLGGVGTRGSQLIILFSFSLFPFFSPLDTLTYKQDNRRTILPIIFCPMASYHCYFRGLPKVIQHRHVASNGTPIP